MVAVRGAIAPLVDDDGSYDSFLLWDALRGAWTAVKSDFTPRNVAIFELAMSGLTHQEIGNRFALSKQRVGAIVAEVVSALTRHLYLHAGFRFARAGSPDLAMN